VEAFQQPDESGGRLLDDPTACARQKVLEPPAFIIGETQLTLDEVERILVQEFPFLREFSLRVT
jgi:hypothetical protein